jgi:DNA-binding Xre family transcriptional regulator
MAGKRINETAPLTAAEKQKRHRVKKAVEEKQSEDYLLSKLRETFISDINELTLAELRKLIKKVYSRNSCPERVTLKELSEMSGISVYQLNKLKAQGIIKPVEDNDLSDIEPLISFSGLTEDEFLRLLKYLDKPITMSDLSTSASIPMRKLERLERMGLFKTA